MSEYLDAISRLEAPERPPMVKYIQKIPFMDYPQHDSEKDWNRVLAQGRNSRLPKYSISQRFNITELDLGQTVYNFDLDKTFITAVGDRKSIAVRTINFNTDSVIEKFTFTFSLDFSLGDTLYIDDDVKSMDNDKNYFADEITKKEYTVKSNKKLLNIIADALVESFTKLLNENGINKNDVVKSLNIDVKNKTITLEVKHVRKDTDATAAKFNFCIGCQDGDEDKFLFDDAHGWSNRGVTPTCVNDNENKCCKFIYNFESYIQTLFIPAAVCSTINPYSIQNIIGSPEEYHDMLNKIFPYDRQNSFQLWFNDADGNRILNKNITGYLDLELIVDNSNNLNLEI